VRAIRTTTISILAVGLLAGSAVGTAAQDEETAEPALPAYATGTVGEPANFVEGTFSEDNRVLRGQRVEGVPVESSDARLAGLYDVAVNGHSQVTDEDGAILESRLYRGENEGGSWVGSGTYVVAWGEDPGAPHIDRETLVLHGEGGYEGLVAYVTHDFAAGEGYEAVILGVEVPPVPEFPAE
jgi:hypothetical protein